MALDFASMLLQPTQATPWNIRLGGGGDSTAREQLALMREKFEYEKKKAEQDREDARSAAAAEKAAAELAHQRTKEAALLAKQQEAQAKFSELAGAGNVEGAQAMVPYLGSLGIDVTNLGSIGGLPVFEMNNRAETAARENAQWENQPPALEGWDGGESAAGSLARMDGMGMPTNTRGQLDEPAGIGSTEDAFGRALAASAHAEATGRPARAPDEEDYTGAVPKNVIDMPAQHAETLARLSPYLSAQVASYPEQYRESAALTQRGVEALGLPAKGSADRFRADRAGVDSAIADELKAEQEALPKELSEMDKSTLRGRGESSAENTYNSMKVPEALETRRQSQFLVEMLDKPDPRLAQLLGPAIMSVAGVKGAQSDRDLAETLGATRQEYLDQGVDWFVQKFIKGGFSEEQKAAFREWLNEGADMASLQAYEFIDTARQRISGGKESEQERTGWKNFLLRMPPEIREEYELYRHDQGDEEAEGDVIGGGRTASAQMAGGGQYDPNQVEPGDGEFEDELEAMAMESDLDPEKIRRVMGPESGGNPSARNPESGATGLIQFMPSVARALGTTTDELAKMSATEQLPFVMRYLSERGVTSDSPQSDYILAVAAPAFIGRPPETVVYRKGSKAWEQNPGWRPPDGGDITVGSIQAFYGGGAPAKAAAPSAEPRSAVDQAVLDILR